MRARIFSGDSCVEDVLVSGVGVEGEVEVGSEEERVELWRISEERSGSLCRAILERDMIPKEERVPQHRKRNVLDAIEKE